MTLSIACTASCCWPRALGRSGTRRHGISCLLVISAIALIAFLRHRAHGSPTRSCRRHCSCSRAIGPAMLGSFLLGAGFLCLDTYVPLYVQGGRGGGVAAAASVVTPVMLTWALSGIIAAPLVVRWGFRNTALLGSCVVIISFVGLLAVRLLDAPHWVLTGVLALTGCGFGPPRWLICWPPNMPSPGSNAASSPAASSSSAPSAGAIGTGLLGMLFNLLIHPADRTPARHRRRSGDAAGAFGT